jgi:hypothetical protein
MYLLQVEFQGHSVKIFKINFLTLHILNYFLKLHIRLDSNFVRCNLLIFGTDHMDVWPQTPNLVK